MKLIVAKDPELYAVLTTEIAQQNVASRLNMHYQVINGSDLTNQRIDRDSSQMIFMFHAATANITGFTTKTIKYLFPNAKLICLGSDTIYYRKKLTHEMRSPYEVDLWLDTIDEVVDEYKSIGINAKKWMWTISEHVMCYMGCKQKGEQQRDFIGLFKVCTKYREDLVKHIKEQGWKILHGGQGLTYNLDDLFSAYSSSRFTLGTTSSSRPDPTRTMKGFRDWLGPACGNVLIYDNHPDVITNFPCPVYDYNDLSTLSKLYNMNETDYALTLEAQQQWLVENTIEQQLIKHIRSVL